MCSTFCLLALIVNLELELVGRSERRAKAPTLPLTAQEKKHGKGNTRHGKIEMNNEQKLKIMWMNYIRDEDTG